LKEASMTKMGWATTGLMLLGAYVVQAFGCSSSPAAVTTSGGQCCACSVSDSASGCSNSKTLAAGAGVTVTDCASFCFGRKAELQMCPGATTPTISGTGVACPSNLVEGGSIVNPDGSVTNPGDGGPVLGGDLGSTCAADADCPTGFTCTKPSDNLIAGQGSGYPNGICTVDCTSDPTMCTALNARCVRFDPDPNAANPKAICLENCKVGPAAAGAVKCHNRADEDCDFLGMTTNAVCKPLCGTDADCPGRKCNLTIGLCSDMPAVGDPIGTACTANGATDPCAGYCIALAAGSNGQPVPGICTADCVFGSVEGCNWRRTAANAGPPIGGCLDTYRQAGDVGDLGICYQLCDTVDDCLIKGAGWVCDHSSAGIEQAFNHGVCLMSAPDAGGATDAGGE